MEKGFKRALSTGLSSLFAFTSLFSALTNDIFAGEAISKGTTDDGFTYENLCSVLQSAKAEYTHSP